MVLFLSLSPGAVVLGLGFFFYSFIIIVITVCLEGGSDCFVR